MSGRSCSVRTGGTLAASGSDAAVLLWTVKDLSHPIAQAALPGFLANISALAYRPDGRTLVVGGEDGSVRFEQLADHTFASRASGVVNAVAFGPDGHTLVDTELFGRSVELREVGDPFDTWSVPADLRSTGRVALAPQGHFMIVANSLSPATLWDTTDIHRPAGPTPLASDVNTSNVYGPIAFSGNGRVFAAISFDAYGLWDVGEQGVPRIIGHLPPTYNVASAVALNPAGRLIALAGTGKTTGLWDMSIPDSPRLINLLSGLVPGPVPALAFSPDGRLLAASSDDNTVRLFDVHDPDHVAPIDTLTGHSGPVNALAFSPDGRTPATGSSDNTARLWDVHDPDHFGLIATLTGHTGSINALAYSSNGRTLATGSSDRGIGLWDADVEHAAAYLCSLAWPRIGEGDWQRYLPGFDYQPPCPG